jgi:hypothetical protein
MHNDHLTEIKEEMSIEMRQLKKMVLAQNDVLLKNGSMYLGPSKA